MHPFFKYNDTKNFFAGMNAVKKTLYTVVVVYQDGYKKEYPCIEKPWQYIAKIKTNPKVKTCYIKS